MTTERVRRNRLPGGTTKEQRLRMLWVNATEDNIEETMREALTLLPSLSAEEAGPMEGLSMLWGVYRPGEPIPGSPEASLSKEEKTA